MERLTKRVGNLQDVCPVSHNNQMVSMRDITNCLAAYEDTELTPEEIKQSCTYPATGCSDCTYTKLIAERDTLKTENAEMRSLCGQTYDDLRHRLHMAESERDTLKKALTLMHGDYEDYIGVPIDSIELCIQQAQEQEAPNAK